MLGKKVAAERKTIGGTPAQPGSDEDDDEPSDNSSSSDTDSLLGGMGAHIREAYLSLGTSGKHGNTPGHVSVLYDGCYCAQNNYYKISPNNYYSSREQKKFQLLIYYN